ncbi:ArsA-related P-loop ATPase [Methanolobus halotolerans]|uniref:ArsA-related P-loop ATPase n=1 Tax=Methanolobus halotolerans TaxID=2052935 RepID=UPI00197C8A23|nr:ArsA-related P-loop ATPase [Methanolobus halotolerans]
MADIRDEELRSRQIPKLRDVIDDLCSSGKEVIFTMGKGGVGKTTIAAAIALGMSRRGTRVHLTTTDPAAHIKYVIKEGKNLTISRIDEEAELARYKKEVFSKARETMSEEDIAYVEEDLRSPCTQEIAVFRAFAQIVERSEEDVVVIDTAPTGHTLLLLDSTLSYHRGGSSVHKATSRRMFRMQTTNKTLRAKASNEIEWINKVDKHSGGNFAVIEWKADEIKGEKLLDLIE